MPRFSTCFAATFAVALALAATPAAAGPQFSPLSLTFVAGAVTGDGTGVAQWRVNGAGEMDRFGNFAVETLSDLDGDGVREVVVASAGEQFIPDESTTRVEVRSGATGAFLHEVTGPHPFGTSVAPLSCIGDLDGDGFEDFAVGNIDAEPGGLELAGRISVFSGIDGSPLYAIEGWREQQILGFSMATPGDVDGDGVADLFHYNGVSEVAAFSGIDGALLFETAIAGMPEGIRVFFSKTNQIQPAGDADGDGIGDLLIGLEFADTNGFENNGVMVVLSGADGSELLRIHGENDDALIGAAVFAPGDLDGDGQGDYLTPTTYFIDASGEVQDPGAVRAYSGADGSVLYEAVAAPDYWGLGPGWDLGAAGDMDADGVADYWASSLLAVTITTDGLNLAFGAVFAFSGADGRVLYRTDSPVTGPIQDPGDASIAFGVNIADAGDTDGDGLHDVFVSASLANEPATNAGAVWLYRTEIPVDPGRYLASLSPFQLNGELYDKGITVAPAMLFVTAAAIDQEPVEVIADGTVVPADGETDYSIALVTTQPGTAPVGNKHTAITDLSQAELEALPEVESVDAFIPQVYRAQGFGEDYAIELPVGPSHCRGDVGGPFGCAGPAEGAGLTKNTILRR